MPFQLYGRRLENRLGKVRKQADRRKDGHARLSSKMLSRQESHSIPRDFSSYFFKGEPTAKIHGRNISGAQTSIPPY